MNFKIITVKVGREGVKIDKMNDTDCEWIIVYGGLLYCIILFTLQIISIIKN